MNERSIFLDALDQADPTQRSAYLDQACAGDAALRQRVEALLKTHAEAGGFLDKLAQERVAEELERQQVAAHPQVGSFLQDDVAAPPSPVAGGGPAVSGRATVAAAVTERPGTVIGPYKLLQPIGEGGMGVVWM